MFLLTTNALIYQHTFPSKNTDHFIHVIGKLFKYAANGMITKYRQNYTTLPRCFDMSRFCSIENLKDVLSVLNIFCFVTAFYLI